MALPPRGALVGAILVSRMAGLIAESVPLLAVPRNERQADRPLVREAYLGTAQVA
jgi:hypothetical protein